MPCVFCGASGPLTREHILPDWINEAFELGAQERFMSQTATGGCPAKQFTRAARGLDHRIKQVCDSCNTTWMSTLENYAKPHLSRLIRGESHRIDRPAQRLLAAWAAKTALVSQAKNPRRLKSHFSEIYAQRQPPHRTHVWIGVYELADNLFGLRHHDLQLREAAEDFRPDHVNGYGATLILGHAVFQVIGHELPGTIERRFPGPALIPIWPKTRREVRWPPAAVITSETLQAIADSAVPGASAGS